MSTSQLTFEGKPVDYIIYNRFDRNSAGTNAHNLTVYYQVLVETTPKKWFDAEVNVLTGEIEVSANTNTAANCKMSERDREAWTAYIANLSTKEALRALLLDFVQRHANDLRIVADYTEKVADQLASKDDYQPLEYFAHVKCWINDFWAETIKQADYIRKIQG